MESRTTPSSSTPAKPPAVTPEKGPTLPLSFGTGDPFSVAVFESGGMQALLEFLETRTAEIEAPVG